MIIALEGIIVKKNIGDIYLNIHGIVYQLFVSKNCQMHLNINETIYLHTTHIIKENEQSLYGFYDLNEKNIFDRLIKISGVGARIALEICSSFTPQTFFDMIQNHDIVSLKRVSGIGAKSAGKILVELNGFNLDIIENNDNKQGFYSDAIMALENLGFSKKDIIPVLNDCVNVNSLQTLIKEALQKLSKQ